MVVTPEGHSRFNRPYAQLNRLNQQGGGGLGWGGVGHVHMKVYQHHSPHALGGNKTVSDGGEGQGDIDKYHFPSSLLLKISSPPPVQSHQHSVTCHQQGVRCHQTPEARWAVVSVLNGATTPRRSCHSVGF